LKSINCDTAIVIAARNEEDNIIAVVQDASQHGDVFVVDDASEDRTAALAAEAGAFVLRHSHRTHIRQAYIDGWRWVLYQQDHTYRYIVQMDAGHSHDTNAIPKLLAPIQNHHANMVVGSRFVTGGKFINQPRWRILLSHCGSYLVRLLTGIPVKDVTSGFRAYNASTLLCLDNTGITDTIKAKAHAFQFEWLVTVWRLGYKIKEVPIIYVGSQSSVKLSTVIEALKTVYRIWREK